MPKNFLEVDEEVKNFINITAQVIRRHLAIVKNAEDASKFTPDMINNQLNYIASEVAASYRKDRFGTNRSTASKDQKELTKDNRYESLSRCATEKAVTSKERYGDGYSYNQFLAPPHPGFFSREQRHIPEVPIDDPQKVWREIENGDPDPRFSEYRL